MSEFKPGDPRINRKGRPKGSGGIPTVKALLKELSSEETDYKTKTGEIVRMPKYKAILLNIIEGALDGDPKDRELYLGYMYGKPAQQVMVDIDTSDSLSQYDAETMLFAQKFLATGTEGASND